jgi:hypothetical protein
MRYKVLPTCSARLTWILALQRNKRIGLVFVQPSRSDGASSLLDVRLEEESLDTADVDALSYVWGDKPRKFRIRCNDKNFDVGQNSYE